MNIPTDIYQHIALMSNDRDILNMLSVNKKFNDTEFFKKIITNRYPLTMRYKKENENWKQFYLRIVKYIYLAKEEFGFPYIPDWRINPEEVYNKLVKVSEGKKTEFLSGVWSEGLRYAVHINRLDLVKEITQNGSKYLKNINDRNIAMIYAASNGNLEILNYLMELYKPSDITFILEAIAGKGNINLLRSFLNKGYKNINYNRIMEAAADTGNVDIINLMLNLGANNYNEVLYTASKRGYENIVKLMLNKGADNINNALEGAGKNNHIEIVKILILAGATNFSYALALAADKGNLDIMELLIDKVTHDDVNNAMKYASIGNKTESMNFLINHGGDAFAETLDNAAYHGHLEIIKLLIPYVNKIDIEKALEKAVEEYYNIKDKEYMSQKILKLESTIEYLKNYKFNN